ncbi:spindle and centriole-associated protein 1 [Takifugu rubripes]|uniref:Spindle and centriole-associated protein 1 n=1 Tax=Takifugu rubripes TaxID=31033 RepID=H2RU13_TAKRU|nr:spindle and centriole-associated protein 1 [Takifugu rubripes]
MSSAKVGRPPHGKGKRVVRIKKAPAPKKEWVNTVNDLSVYKLTNAELNHRHEIHKSHNKAAAQWELKEKAFKRRFRHIGSPAPLDQASISIIREVFSDQLLLKDVLARSDRALAVVKDLFGDAPHMQTGHPSVTMAPKCDSDLPPPEHQRVEPPTRLSLIGQQALNEVDVWEEECSDEDPCSTACSDCHVIQRANLQKMKARSKKKSSQQVKDKPKSEHSDGEDFLATPSTAGKSPNPTALNATVTVQRVQPRQNQLEKEKEDPSNLVSQVLNPELTLNKSGKIQSDPRRINRTRVSQSSELTGSSVSSLNGDQTSLQLLQDMLSHVEAELDTVILDTESAPNRQRTHAKQGLTGFSVALVSTLGRLVHLLKQRDEVIHKDVQERQRLEEELKEQRGLINALTTETMTLRKDVAALQARLQQQTAEMEQKLDAMAMVMGGLGALQIQDDIHQEPKVKAAVYQQTPAAERNPQSGRSCASPAVLLSPPRQGHKWQQMPVTGPAPPHHACGSAPSLASLPPTSSVSQIADFSPEAMLAEITKISRENEAIKAQFSQARDLGPASGGAPDSEQRGQRASSAGSFTTQTERSGGLRNHQGLATEGQMLLTQESSSNLSVNSIEQRLLEINRQSAAARGRLLELIEQQKQNASSVVSPCASPVPASAFSPQYAAGGRSPDASMMLPEKAFLSQTGRHAKEFGIPGVSSQSFRGEQRGKTQMDRERHREGWFSLSSHMR